MSRDIAAEQSVLSCCCFSSHYDVPQVAQRNDSIVAHTRFVIMDAIHFFKVFKPSSAYVTRPRKARHSVTLLFSHFESSVCF